MGTVEDGIVNIVLMILAAHQLTGNYVDIFARDIIDVYQEIKVRNGKP